jgi:hypothetical protein
MLQDTILTQKPAGIVTSLWNVVLASVLSVLAALYIAPLHPRMPAAGLDPSWQLVIEHAFRNSLQFGKDIVFTFGPLGFLYTGLFAPDTYIWLVLAWTLFSVLLTTTLLALRPDATAPPVLAVLFVIAAAALFPNDGFLLLSPLLLIVLQTTRPERRGLAVALAVVLAAFALSKFTAFLIASLVIAIAAAIDALKHRRMPLPLIAFAASFALLYRWSGQEFSSLIPYISGALEISSGYSRAMQVKGPWREIAAFTGLSAVLAVSLMAMEVRHARRRREYVVSAGIVAALLLSLFMIFKAAFVRHDGHALIGWSGLVLSTAFLSGRARIISGNLGAAVLLAIGLASFAGATLSHRYQNEGETTWPLGVFTTAGLADRVDTALATALDWPARLRALEGERQAALARIRAEHPIGPIEGSVDLFTSDQAILLAHGLEYRPRPVFQSYSAYTPSLIERNRDAFRGDGRPKTVLFMPSVIDNRFPSLDSGALWPVLIQHYDAVDLRDGFAVLRERPQPRPVSLPLVSEVPTTFDSRLAVPDGDGPLWVEIDLKRNIAGKLVTTAFKEPEVLIHAEFGAAGWRTWRLVPSMSGAGFLLSPVVGNTMDFLSFFSHPESREWQPAKRPTAIRITTGFLGSRVFDNRIQVRFHRLTVPPAPAAQPSDALLSLLGSQRTFNLLAASWKNSTPIAPEIRNDNLLFAHAPMTLSLPAADLPGGETADALQVGFGMFDGTWSRGGESDGVCFEVWNDTASGESNRLWRRCLNPVEVEADRGKQSATIAIPRQSASTLRFVTDAGPSNAWDWSYWSEIKALAQRAH